MVECLRMTPGIPVIVFRSRSKIIGEAAPVDVYLFIAFAPPAADRLIDPEDVTHINAGLVLQVKVIKIRTFFGHRPVIVQF